jgi:ADP-L-glycero-D-manno-heptose 6-epimerase
VGYGSSRSFQDIADILQQELGTNLGTQYFKNPYTGYQMDTCADLSLSVECLNYQPQWSLEKGIKNYIPYIKDMFGVENK